MSIQSRCPSCAAALPTGAAWCSLCHADLRARREPVAASALPRTDQGPETPDTAVVRDDVTDLRTESRTEPVRTVGRHSKEPAGRREARRPSSTRTLDPVAALEGLELPAGEVSEEQVDALADQMLARLAVTQPRSRFLDPSDVPGGKWGVGIGAGLAVVCLMLVVFTILGSVLG